MSPREKVQNRPWNPYISTCPTRQVLDCVADKWAVLIIGLLMTGGRRFGRIRREVDGISQKILTQTLRSLERHGIVRRLTLDGRVAAVEYSLTELGSSLSTTLDQLRVWAEQNMDMVIESQHRYDSLHASTRAGARQESGAVRRA